MNWRYLFPFQVIICLFAAIVGQYLGDGDVYSYYKYSLDVIHYLKHHPFDFQFLFARDLLDPSISKIQIFPTGISRGWMESGSWFMIRWHVLLNIIAGTNFYVHTIFYAMLLSIGTWCLLCITPPNKYSLLLHTVLGIILLWPTHLYFRSVMHKEGMIFTSIGILAYLFRKPLWFLKDTAITLLILYFSYLTRIWSGVLLLFFLPVKYLTLFLQKSAYKISIGYVMVTLFLGSLFLIFQPENRLFGRAVVVGNDFMHRHGKTDYTELPIVHSFSGVTKNIPFAFANVFFAPFQPNLFGMKSLLFFLEGVLFFLFFLWGIYLFIKSKKDILSIYFPVIIVGMILFIGLVVDNLGSLVRYRSIPFFFIMYWLWYLIFLQKENKNASQFR